MDYTLNIVVKCRFFAIFKHLQALKRSWKIFHGVPGSPGKVPDFFSVKEWEPGFSVVGWFFLAYLMDGSVVQSSDDIKHVSSEDSLLCELGTCMLH